MLRFQTSPDPVMTAILATALEVRANSLDKRYPKGADGDLQQDWKQRCILLSRSLTPEQAIGQQRLLRKALLEPTVYMPTDMQFLILFDVLSALIARHNHDFRRSIVCRELGLDPYPIDQINLKAIVDIFFWDTDFLMNMPPNNPVIPHLQHIFHISDSAVRASSGQPVLPEDLQLTSDQWDDIVPPDQATSYYRPDRSWAYPFEEKAIG